MNVYEVSFAPDHILWIFMAITSLSTRLSPYPELGY